VIQYLLKCGADVNKENHKGSTPLHIYCYGDPTSGT
jgi:ankyrin repeat protein